MLAAAALTIVYVARALTRRTPRPLIAAVVVVAAAMLIPPAALEVNWQRNEHAYSAAASALVGHPVTVRCQRLTETLVDADGHTGHVAFTANGQPDTNAHLDWAICTQLRTWPHNDAATASTDSIAAIHTLVHEIEHLSGTLDERAADCRAIIDTPTVVTALGGTIDSGRIAARRYLHEVYPHMSDTYTTRDCAATGPFATPDTAWLWSGQ